MSVRAELLRLGLRWSKRRAPAVPDIVALRERLEGIKRWVPDPPAGTTAARLDASGVKAVRVTTSASLDDRHILYFHGGAYNFGTPSLYRDFIWRVASAGGARVLCISYRLAPEHPFPAAVDDVVQPTAGCWRMVPRLDGRRSWGTPPAAGWCSRRFCACAMPAFRSRARRLLCRRGPISP